MFNAIGGVLNKIAGGASSVAQYVAGYGTRNLPGQDSSLYNVMNGNNGQDNTLPVTSQPQTPYGPFIPTANAQTAAPTSRYVGMTNEAGDALSQSIADQVAAQHAALPISDKGNSTFSVSNGSAVPSNYANSNTSVQDVLDYRNNMHSDMTNGNDPSLYPTTDNAARTYYTQTLPGAIAMSPEQQQAYSQMQTSQKAITDFTLQTKKQIADLYSSGKMTKDQADQAAQDIQREADARMAELQSTSANAGLSYNSFEIGRQNTIAATQAMAPFFAPTQVSPGSTMVAGGTGQPIYQGAGATPQGIFSSALELWQASPTYNSDGTPNYQPAMDQAQSYYSTHQLLGAGGAGSMGNSPSVPSPQPRFIGQPQQDGTYTMPDGGAVNATYAQKIAMNFAPQLQTYISTGPQGTAYINSDKVSKLPPAIQTQIASAAAKSGMPTLDGTAAAGLQSVYSLYNNLDAMTSLVDQTLTSGTAGHIKDWATAKINDIFQNKPILQNFNNLRTLAGQADTNLMGGIGSGFRQNTANLGVSIQNLPVATDSYENAMVKIAATRKLLDSAMSKTFPGFQGSGSITSTGSSKGSSSSTTVNIGDTGFVQDSSGKWVVSQ